MKRSFQYRATLLLSISLAISAAALSAKSPLTNDDVQGMLSQGLTDDVVVQAISAGPPGEYGLLLDPKKSEKEYSGTANVNGDAIRLGLLSPPGSNGVGRKKLGED